MRIGELLVAEGYVTTQQVDQALRGQVMWGARLGTNLVELGLIDLDNLSRGLGKLHGLPPAFARHFDNADAAVQKLLPARVADQYACIPLARLPGDRIVCATTSPLDHWAIDVIAGNLELTADKVAFAIAPELRLRYYLEHTYKVPRPARFLRARKRGNSLLPSFEVDVSSFGEDVDIPIDVDEAPRAKPPPIPTPMPKVSFKLPEPAAKPSAPGGADRRSYVRTLADEDPKAPPPIPAAALGRIEIKKATPADLIADTIKSIKRAPDRDTLGKRVIEAIEKFSPAKVAVLLVPRGDVVTSWLATRELPEIAVPADGSGLVPTALAGKLARATKDRLGTIDARLLEKLGGGGELAAAPIAVGGTAWCAIVLVLDHGATLEHVDAITSAAAVTFARLWRDANR